MSNVNFNWLLDTPIAHRGLHDDNYPENSMPAYQAAIDHGFNIEIDVHLTKDGHIVVFHDDNLKRVCGVDKKVKDCTLEELKTYRLKGTEYTIPTFDEFLALVDGKVGVLCEIKGVIPWELGIAKATVERLKTYKGNIALQSFNFGAVIYCRRHDDVHAYGQLCTWGGDKINHWVDWLGKLIACKFSKPLFVAYDIRNAVKAKKYLDKAKADGKKLLCWTINSADKLALARKIADNVIFEDICDLIEAENK